MDGTNAAAGGNVPSAETPASGPGDTASSERTRSGGDANLDRSGGGNVSGEATGDSSLVSVMVQMLREERQARQQQVDLLTRLVESSLPSREVRETSMPKMAKLESDDDIEAYLTTFERMMRAYNVAEESWPFRLAPNLTGKAQQAFAALDAEKAKVYREVKAAILRRYNVTEETYRREFRQLKRRDGEPFQEVTTRLAHLLQQWTRDCSTADEVREVFVIEQFLSILPMEMRLLVQERKPPTGEAAGRLADEYAEARAPASGGPPRVRTCFVCGKGGHMALDCPDRKTTNKVGEPKSDGRGDTSRPAVKCYRCHQPGHIALHCPQNAWYCGPQGDGEILAAGYVDGLPVHDMVADTGCSRTLVHASLVPPAPPST